MKRANRALALCAVFGLFAGGCGDDGQTMDPPDASVTPDGGFAPALCPDPIWGPACSASSDCKDDGSPPQNCQSPTYCLPYNQALCVFGACQMPPLLMGDPHTVLFDVKDISPRVESFAGLVVAAETAGGSRIGCADVYDGFDLSQGCVNILDSRAVATFEGGTLYGVSFNGFASGLDALFVVYGFAQAEAQGAPHAVSCTESAIGPPGGGAQRIAGDMMRPIQ